jgi:hypothetical protein
MAKWDVTNPVFAAAGARYNDPDRHTIWLDGFTSERSRTIEPSVQDGGRYYELFASCMRVYRLQAALGIVSNGTGCDVDGDCARHDLPQTARDLHDRYRFAALHQGLRKARAVVRDRHANAGFNAFGTHGDARLYHGVSSYILIGMAFALIHQRVDLLVPGSYQVVKGAERPMTGGWADYVWLSFSIMTTSGFAVDVTPCNSISRAVCTAEGVTGVMFPAIFLARMVSAASEEDEKGIS